MRYFTLLGFTLAIGGSVSASAATPVTEPRRPISVGLSSNDLFLHTGATALSGLFQKDATMDIQVDLAIPQSDPFLWGLSAEIKNTIHGDRDLGFHVGGGLGFGQFAKDTMFFSLGGLAGFHWTFLGRLSAHIDGGLTFTHEEIESEENQFRLTGHSSHFGLSLLYRFD